MVTALSDATDWLTLSSIGRSRAVSLTIIIPFVGYIILFNEYIIKYFLFARAVIVDVSPNIDIDIAQNKISLENLYFLYFGLLFLGLASSLFSFFCPEEIKQNKTSNEFIKSEEELKTPTIVISYLNFIFQKYLDSNESEENDNKNIFRKLEYPDEIDQLHYNLIYEIFENLEHYENNENETEVLDAEHQEYSEGNGYEGVFYYGSGYLNIHSITDTVLMNRRITFHFVKQFRSTARDYYRDILFIKFLYLRKSKSALRIAIGSMYAFGIALLILPTIKTSIFIIGLPFD